MNIYKIAWLTDIHLNFLTITARIKFYQNIAKTNADAVLITGDIAEANDICKLLEELNIHTNMPIYFILGNHDYYLGSIANVRKRIITLCDGNDKLIWLGRPKTITLNEHTLLVGHDGWADGRYGNFDHSSINLNDSRFISELFQAASLSKKALKDKMQKLADEDAKTLEFSLNIAAEIQPKRVIVATHVPPFPECCWHEDKPNNEHWLPYFSSKATGDVLSTIAKKHPKINFLVLCGHTHTKSSIKFSENLEIKTGKAQYYQPELQAIISI